MPKKIIILLSLFIIISDFFIYDISLAYTPGEQKAKNTPIYDKTGKTESENHQSTKDPTYFNNDLYKNELFNTEENLKYLGILKDNGYIDDNGNLTEDGKNVAGDDAKACGNKCVEKLINKGKEIDTTNTNTNTNTNTTAKDTTAKDTTEKKIDSEGLMGTGFVIDTGLFGLGGNKLKDQTEAGKDYNSTQKINFALGKIIGKMMIGLGIISLLIMTIGAGFMITYNGQDEMLSKGKTIFKAGIISLVVALSSGMIVNLISFILYNK